MEGKIIYVDFRYTPPVPMRATQPPRLVRYWVETYEILGPLPPTPFSIPHILSRVKTEIQRLWVDGETRWKPY